MTDNDLFTKESYAGLFIIGNLVFFTTNCRYAIMIMMVVNSDNAYVTITSAICKYKATKVSMSGAIIFFVF